MQTIVQPHEHVRRIWGKQSIQAEAAYRLMNYLLSQKIEDGLLLHNVVTGHLVLLSEEEAKLLEMLPAGYAPWMDELITDHFLVPENFDEHRSVLQLRMLLRKLDKKSSKYITGYTILPTTYCNARCFYCYEADYQHVHMTEEIAHRTVEFIREHCDPDREVHIGWFGGEPTIAADRIDQICNELTAAGISYQASMISNGYLLDAEMAERAKNLWKLNMVQITLDGTEEVYNRVKAYHAVTGSPYQQVLRNIAGLLEREIRVSVRMNLDHHNADNLQELIDELAARFAGNNFFSAYVHPLFGDCGFDPVIHTDDDRVWLSRKQEELNERIKEKNMYRSPDRFLPRLKVNCCMSDMDSSVIIGSDGHLAKCEHYVDEVAGDIWHGLDPEKIRIYYKTIENAACKACALFPQCVRLEKCQSADACFEANRAEKFKSFERVMIKAYQQKTREEISHEEVCRTQDGSC